MAVRKDMAFDLGETWIIQLACHEDKLGRNPMNLTGAQVTLRVATTPGALVVDTANGVVIGSPATLGLVTIAVTPNAQFGVAIGEYPYTIRVTKADGTVSDQAFGTLSVVGTAFPPLTLPAWIEDLRAPSGDLPVFAYNFAAGGQGQGWDGSLSRLLTVDQAWVAPFWSPNWDPGSIFSGRGLEPNSNPGITPLGLLPASVQGPAGATLRTHAKAFGGATAATVGEVDCNMSNLPNDSNDGNFQVTWIDGAADMQITLGDCDGNVVATDMFGPKTSEMRAAYNYRWDGADLYGSINGRPNVRGAGRLHPDVANCVYSTNTHTGATDAVIYVTIVAVYTPQPLTDLPTLSALP